MKGTKVEQRAVLLRAVRWTGDGGGCPQAFDGTCPLWVVKKGGKYHPLSLSKRLTYVPPPTSTRGNLSERGRQKDAMVINES